MPYRERFIRLRELYNPHARIIRVPEKDIEIHHCNFTSTDWTVLPGAQLYNCREHGLLFEENLGFAADERLRPYPETLKHADREIPENKYFPYVVFKKSDSMRAQGVILLLHGLNERSWLKYLPWAEKLVELTGKAVILFPIAFHMNRTPAEWGESRAMHDVSALRYKHSPALMNSSFANAAISTRIELIPQRFFWSGLQTFGDVAHLISDIKSCAHSLFSPEATIDLFAYSIGSFLSEILMMANPDNYFQNSKLFMFCGGPTLDRMSPSSKYILDSDATIAIYSFYTERLEAELKRDRRIAHYFSEAHPVGMVFRMLLTYQKNKDIREQRIRQLRNQLCAVALKNDDVVPASEVLNTLKGEYRDIGTQVEVMDFPSPSTHVNPFPINKFFDRLVESSFNEVFEKAARHFR